MSNHSKLGDIALPVGAYEVGDKKKKRYRNIGVLMETTEDDGTKRLWIRLNADIFHASLFSLASINRIKGEDTVTAPVFEPRDPNKPRTKEADEVPESEPY